MHQFKNINNNKPLIDAENKKSRLIEELSKHLYNCTYLSTFSVIFFEFQFLLNIVIITCSTILYEKKMTANNEKFGALLFVNFPLFLLL